MTSAVIDSIALPSDDAAQRRRQLLAILGKPGYMPRKSELPARRRRPPLWIVMGRGILVEIESGRRPSSEGAFSARTYSSRRGSFKCPQDSAVRP